MKRTRRESIKRCKRIWELVKDTGCTKLEAYNKLGFKCDDVNICPCCEYNETHKKNYCQNNNCILSWKNGGCIDGEYCYYFKALISDSLTSEQRVRLRKKSGELIVALCNRALEELDKK